MNIKLGTNQILLVICNEGNISGIKKYTPEKLIETIKDEFCADSVEIKEPIDIDFTQRYGYKPEIVATVIIDGEEEEQEIELTAITLY